MHTSTDEFVRGGGGSPPNAGLASCVLPEVPISTRSTNSDTVVSTFSAPYDREQQHWYTIRCTYGREKKAYEYLSSKDIKVFYPTITTRKMVSGKNMLIEESRLPNIFFAYENFENLKEYVYDNVHDETKYLRFYYNQHHDGTREPLSSSGRSNCKVWQRLEGRYERKSVIITSQLPLDKWYEYIAEATLADAIMDRLINSSHHIALDGPSLG